MAYLQEPEPKRPAARHNYMEAHGLGIFLHQLVLELPIPRDDQDKLQEDAMAGLGTGTAEIYGLAAAQEHPMVQ